MGRIVVSELVTLDGVIEDPAGLEGFEHGGWALRFDLGEDGRQIKLEEVFEAEALLLGRVTYEGLASSWSEERDDFGVAMKARTMPKYVVSSRREEPEWENTTVLRGDVVEQATTLKRELDGEILVSGSAQLVRTLFEEDLLDEIRIMVYPLLLGTGKRLFARGTEPKAVRLTKGDTVGCGISYFVFEPREKGEPVRRRPDGAPRVGGGGPAA